MDILQIDATETDEIMQLAQLLDDLPDLEASRRYLSEDRNVFFMAYKDGLPIGFLRGSTLLQLKTRRKQMFFYEIGVDKNFRRQGIGKRLVEKLIEYCRTRDYEEIFVLTSPTNQAAIKLYISTGAVTETDGDRMYVYKLKGN